MTAPNRKIIHLDMDAFFASVEQRDNPELVGKPVVVGGRPNGRGVVAAASYEARKFGIHSAMSSAVAYRRCPDAIFVRPRIDIYRRISRVIMAILREYTDLVEPLSFDEAFMDVTRNKKGIRYASRIAADAREKIFAYTGLTASAGVAPNKFLAKIASDINKPNGMKVITPDQIDSFLLPLPVRKIPGVGKVTEEKLFRLGIHTVEQLRARSEQELIHLFGKTGSWYYQISRGIDDRAVVPYRERKSIGAEDTLEFDTLDIDFIRERIAEHARRITTVLQKKNATCRTVSLKVKYADFEINTRSRTLSAPTTSLDEIVRTALELVSSTEAGDRPVRLIGVSLSNLSSDEEETLGLEENIQLPLSFAGPGSSR